MISVCDVESERSAVLVKGSSEGKVAARDKYSKWVAIMAVEAVWR